MQLACCCNVSISYVNSTPQRQAHGNERNLRNLRGNCQLHVSQPFLLIGPDLASESVSRTAFMRAPSKMGERHVGFHHMVQGCATTPNNVRELAPNCCNQWICAKISQTWPPKRRGKSAGNARYRQKIHGKKHVLKLACVASLRQFGKSCWHKGNAKPHVGRKEKQGREWTKKLLGMIYGELQRLAKQISGH